VLPEFIIPFQSYSLFFVLTVLKDYFGGSLTVEDICTKYDISVSTLYSWKTLFLKHKKIWLGLLEDSSASAGQFLEFLATGGLLHILKEFFHLAGRSFLQVAPIENRTFYAGLTDQRFSLLRFT